MKIRKNLEKGSATMIVIFVIFFIVIILSTFLVYVTSKRNNQLMETEKLSEIYNGDMQEIYEERKNRESRIEAEIKKCHGPNEPDLKVGMTPVKFNEATTSKKGEIIKTILCYNIKNFNRRKCMRKSHESLEAVYIYIYIYRRF